MTDERPTRKTDNMRIGRVSIPQARYFITLCTKSRKADLTNGAIAETIRECWREQHQSQDYVFHCGTIMPDHIHWLCTLGERLNLAQIISKFKARTRTALANHQLEWQRNYYDHRLRAEAVLEKFAKYIFLNPYRKQLISINTEWPSWTLNKNYKPEFLAALKSGAFPQAEWLANELPLNELVAADLEPET